MSKAMKKDASPKSNNDATSEWRRHRFIKCAKLKLTLFLINECDERTFMEKKNKNKSKIAVLIGKFINFDQEVNKLRN